MDPLMLIVTALAAGAAAGLSDSASSAVKDSYAGLKELVRKRLDGRPSSEVVLAGYEQAPATWRTPLLDELDHAHACHDLKLLAAAEELLGLVDELGVRRGKYSVDAPNAQGLQIGDHNMQTNVFKIQPTELVQYHNRQQAASSAMPTRRRSPW